MSIRACQLAATLLTVAFVSFHPAPARAVESDLEDQTVAESVKEVDTKLSTGLGEEKPPPGARLPRLWSVLPDLPPFLRDTRLVLKPRMYYYRRSEED
ncbi:MAG: hypothetical protein JRH10_23045, partial [Deltaproteobacteria bacterium]|nr:hypothetical protein [Deltaproteobacteria bacterium]